MFIDRIGLEKRLVFSMTMLAGGLGMIGSASAQEGRTAGARPLTAAQKAAGWCILFDGSDTSAWRAYKGTAFPQKGWTVSDGCLRTVPTEGAVDIVTVDEFGDFELVLEWAVAAKSNSGIMFRCTEDRDATWQSGPEIQILDDAGHGAAADAPHSAGALYDLYSPSASKVLRPVGEFNEARLRLRDGVFQHWLNGVKLIECRVDDAEFAKRVASSKFAAYPGFGTHAQGRFALQHHGGDVRFRNIRARDLSAPMPGEVRLFNGRDMSGFKAVLPDGGTMEDVWAVRDGILVCKGNPVGYIRTEKEFTNYVLKLDWRFNPVTRQAGNSGVLLRMIGADKVWPRSVEAQLESGNAGDFWNIDEFPMKAAPERTNGRNTKKTHFNERPVGEWNEYEIIVDHSTVTLIVNGEVLNEAWDVQEVPGRIGLQSEGAEIHFRNIRLAPIP